MKHGSDDAKIYQPFERETGIFVSNGEDGELRAHRDERGRYHFHRWVLAPHGLRDEMVWRGPVAFGLTAGDIYDAADALRRAVDSQKQPAKREK